MANKPIHTVQGGLGTDVAPATGQIPVGQADGTYLPTTVTAGGVISVSDDGGGIVTVDNTDPANPIVGFTNPGYITGADVPTNETDPLSLHLDQTTPQTFTGGDVTGTGILGVTTGTLELRDHSPVKIKQSYYLNPNGDVATGWLLAGGSPPSFAVIDQGVLQPNIPDTSGAYLLSNAAFAVDTFDMSTQTISTSTVDTVTVWVYGGGDIFQIDAYLNGAWAGPQAIAGGGNDWRSVTFTGTFTQTDIDDLQVQFIGDEFGVNAAVYSMYVEIPVYTIVDSVDSNTWLKLNQTERQTVFGGSPLFDSGITTDLIQDKTNGLTNINLSNRTLNIPVSFVASGFGDGGDPPTFDYNGTFTFYGGSDVWEPIYKNENDVYMAYGIPSNTWFMTRNLVADAGVQGDYSNSTPEGVWAASISSGAGSVLATGSTVSIDLLKRELFGKWGDGAGNYYFTDAPMDGTTYGRKDGAWEVASGGSMVYPGAGVAVSTGSAWDTSLASAPLSSLAGLTYSSTSFVKMTASNTFALDTNTYLTAAVTSVATGTGLTGGTITSTGTIALNSKLSPADSLAGNSLKFLRVNAGETAVEYATVSGSGTVTSIATNSPITGGTITTTGTIGISNAKADSTTKGAATFLAADFNDDLNGLISIDYTNGQAASASLKGFLTSADWSTFNGKQAAGNYITALTGDVTASGPGSVAATIANNAVTYAKFQQVAASSLVGNPTGSLANAQGITLTAPLVFSGTTLATSTTARTKEAVRVTATAALTVTYSNGSSGVGATLTNADTQVALAIDSVTLSVNDRVLVTNQASSFQNGIYTVTDVGSGSTNWVMTRATDFDGSTIGAINYGLSVVTVAGTVNAGIIWIYTGITSPTLGTTAITFVGNSASTGGAVSSVSNSDSSLTISPTTGAVVASLSSNNKIRSVGITIDGGGSALTTGSKGFIEVPYGCTISRVTVLGNASGSVVVDIKKSSYSGFPSTSSICASAKPTLSSAQKSQDSTLTGWTTSISAGDILEFNVDSATTVTRVNLILKVITT